MRVVSSTIEALTPNFIALGNFDGVHRGHQQVIIPTVSKLAAMGSMVPSSTSNYDKASIPHATVVTFDPHPQEFFTGKSRRLLTPLPEKVRELEKLGIQQLVLLPFDRELASLTPAEFVQEILVQRLQTHHISVGMDFCFGRGRSGTSADLKAIAATFDVEVHITPLCTEQEERISSSAIRTALSDGQLTKANQLLGRPYRLQGSVVQGQQLGRTLGFPTANLNVTPTKFLPRYGVYAVRVREIGNIPRQANHLPQDQWGVLNIGCRPTVDPGSTQPTIEVHLLDWSGDLYGQTLALDLMHFLRPEQQFASLAELKAQIQQDCSLAQTLLSSS